MAGTGKSQCPCGGAAFAQCCGRFIGQAEKPRTAAELMRSRYTAYAMRDAGYLQATWHASTRPALPITDEKLKWIGLEIRKQTQDGDQATVEFVARYRVDGRAHRLHENSRFVREGGSWFYVDGSFLERKN
ncbi:MAG: YchJ family metal-binding protein [Pseudomonadota bacterium]